MSFSVYLRRQPETKAETFRRAMSDTGQFLLRIGHKVLRIGSVALWRDKHGSMCRTKLEGATADGTHVYGQGLYLAVREFGRSWRLRTEL